MDFVGDFVVKLGGLEVWWLSKEEGYESWRAWRRLREGKGLVSLKASKANVVETSQSSR